MKLDVAIGQLRHTYQMLMDEQVKDQKELAKRLIGPVIESLERLHDAPTWPYNLSLPQHDAHVDEFELQWTKIK